MRLSQLRGRGVVALSAVALISFGLGYYTSSHVSKGEVASEDSFGIDASKVLAATVTSMKAENKLVVYRFSGDARVMSTDVYGGFLRAGQELIVPATTVYFVDMAEFGSEDVRFDKTSKTVEIEIPPLKIGDISLQAESARQINKGLITMNNDVVQNLVRRNFAAARKAFVVQAQNPELVRLAKEQAIRDVASQFEIPLRAVGLTEVKVRAYFR